MAKRKVPDRVRIQQLTNRVKDLEGQLTRSNRERRLLKNQANLLENLAGGNAEFVRIVNDYFASFHTLSLMADPGEGIRYDTPKVSSSGHSSPAYNHRAAWAANRLDHEIQHFYDLLLHLNQFIHSPYPTDPVKKRRSGFRCEHCRLPHCQQEAS